MVEHRKRIGDSIARCIKLFGGGGSTLPASEAPKEIPAEVVKHGEIPVAEIIEETKRVPRKVPRVNDDSK